MWAQRGSASAIRALARLGRQQGSCSYCGGAGVRCQLGAQRETVNPAHSIQSHSSNTHTHTRARTHTHTRTHAHNLLRGYLTRQCGVYVGGMDIAIVVLCAVGVLNIIGGCYCAFNADAYHQLPTEEPITARLLAATNPVYIDDVDVARS